MSVIVDRISQRAQLFKPTEVISWLALAFGPLLLLSIAVLAEDDWDLYSQQVAAGLGELNYPPDYPKMPGEPPRVQPSKKVAAHWDEHGNRVEGT